MRRRRSTQVEGKGAGEAAEAKSPKNYYFKTSNLDFIQSGCVTLDCVLGGGWPLGRISNVIGDKSTGKTLLATEACANFARKWPEGHIWYREVERAFDLEYATGLGLPEDRVDFGEEGLDTTWETVEDIFEDLKARIADAKESGQPGLYIIDSLDALSSRAELTRSIDEGSYGMEKQKKLGELFRRLNKGMSQSKIHFLMISQIRDNIGAMFNAPKTRRAGGRALDFYASQVIWLSHLKTLNQTRRNIKRSTGIRVKVKCTKNKVGLPHRDCEFSIKFGYGIDELPAAMEFLEQAGAAKDFLNGTKLKDFMAETEQLDDAEYRARIRQARKLVKRAWREVDEQFAPRRRKY